MESHAPSQPNTTRSGYTLLDSLGTDADKLRCCLAVLMKHAEVEFFVVDARLIDFGPSLAWTLAEWPIVCPELHATSTSRC